MVSAHCTEQLCYRELADRLGISPDAAIMMAKKKTHAGFWRIIPGSDTGECALVELPTGEFIWPNGPAPSKQDYSGSTAGLDTQDQADLTNARLRASLSEAVALLQPAQDEIEQLRTLLREAKEAHSKVAVKLAAVEIRGSEEKAEPKGAAADRGIDLQVLKEEIVRDEERRQRAWWKLGRFIR